jgi:uncharacterized damage-inducible protein DinB
MKAIDLIRWAMNFSEQGTNRIVEDMKKAPLTQPCSNGGNHPLWNIGHLAYIEGAIRHVVTGEANPVEKWAPLFATGSQPKTDAAAYPPFEEILRSYRDLRAANKKMLDQLGEAGLDRTPKFVPPGFEEAMKTNGQALLLITLHNMVHYGQITDCRRAAGLKPLM